MKSGKDGMKISKRLLKRYCCLSLPNLRDVLAKEHGLHASVKELSKQSRLAGISRRGKEDEIPRSVIRLLVKDELAISSKFAGYRTMWMNLILKYGITIRRQTVESIMRELVPGEASDRRNRRIRRRQYLTKGPNYAWHIDGQDKLKRYGLCVHGCIDGYSRKILWLKVGRTNNDPSVVARYFLDCVEKVGGVPRVIRGDCGTENVLIELIQRALRYNYTDAMAKKSFLYGKSTSNTRIERLWGSLREMNLDFFLELFHGFDENGTICCADSVHLECIRYFFMDIIQHRLDNFTKLWNMHRIRKGRTTTAGVPYHLYSQSDMGNYLFPVSRSDILEARQYTSQSEPVHANISYMIDCILLSHWPDIGEIDSERKRVELAVAQLKYVIQVINRSRNKA